MLYQGYQAFSDLLTPARLAARSALKWRDDWLGEIGDIPTAQQDLESDKLVPRRLERDPAPVGVPEVIGGEVALRLGGDHFTRDGVDLVQLIDDGDLDRSRR